MLKIWKDKLVNHKLSQMLCIVSDTEGLPLKNIMKNQNILILIFVQWQCATSLSKSQSVISRTNRCGHIIIMLKLQNVFVQIAKCISSNCNFICPNRKMYSVIRRTNMWPRSYHFHIPYMYLDLSLSTTAVKVFSGYHLVPKNHWYLKPGCFPSATPTSTTPLPFLAMEKEHATKVTIIIAQIVTRKW